MNAADAAATPQSPLLRGIFFDLDDTLIGYAEAERQALVAGCVLASHVNPAIDADALASAIYDAYERRYAYGTPGYADLAHVSVAELRGCLTADALETLGAGGDPVLVNTLVDAYEAAERASLLRFPDAAETLQALRPHFRLGLITNGPSRMQRAKLAALALDACFDVIVVDTEFGHPKPDPRIFAHAANQIGLAPAELLFVGNSLSADIAGACGAGWTSVWLPEVGAGRLGPDDPAPDHVITRLSELLTLPRVAAALAAAREFRAVPSPSREKPA